MEVIDSVLEMKQWSKTHSGKPIAAVFTMGALHRGHQELMTFAREWVKANKHQDCFVVASIFVNPTQFNNQADLAKYPRSLETDLEICEAAGVDVVFVPTVEQMYPEGVASTALLDSGDLKNTFEGKSRPGHFDGMVTVVNKLFDATNPQYAFFGEKDFQQLVILKQYVDKAKLPIEIVGVPTVRDENQLALASRNSRLSAHGLELAAHIPIALEIVALATNSGVNISLARQSGIDYLRQFKEIEIDYLEITGEHMEVNPTSEDARVLIAVTIEGVRLLDNFPIHIRNS